MRFKKKISLFMASVFLVNNLSFVTGNDISAASAGNNDSVVSGQALTFDETASSQAIAAETENKDFDIIFKVNNDWGNGFSGEITIKNNTDKPIENWKLDFDFTHSIDSLWNGIITEHTDDHYTVTNAGYNSTIAAGTSLTVGFNGNPGLVNGEPVNYLLTYDGGSFTSNTKEAEEKVELPINKPEIEDGETFTFEGHTYAYIDKSMTWYEAKEYCENLGGHLATITSAEEQTFISDVVLTSPKMGYYWLGATDSESEGTWKWITGEEWNYTYWDGPQPDNAYDEDYLHLYSNSKRWNDLNYDASRYYGLRNFGLLCEWENSVKHSRYEVFYDDLTWTDAEAYCESLGGHLATVTSEEEYETILSLIPSNARKSVFWIGGTSAGNNGVWKWITGEEWSYDNWGGGQPSGGIEQYLGFVTTNHGWAAARKWNDFTNTGTATNLREIGFVCEWDDGELFYGKNAFDYALFTGSNEANTILYTNNTTVNGDIHSNSSFYYQGNFLKIDGVCETVGNINAYLSSGSGSYINEKEENTDSIEMLDITDKIKEHIAEISDEDIYFGQNAIEVTDNIGTSQNIQFNGTTFNGKGIVYAGENISYNVNSLNKDTENKVLLCSDNGNITINGSDISLNGIIYAPNGTVTINANSFMINGRIICDKFVFNGTTLYINAQDDDLDFIKDLLPEKDIAKSPEIQLSVDKTAVKKGENYTVTAKITNNVTPKTFEVYLNDKLYTSEQGEFTLTADTVGQQVIRCVATNKLGAKTQKSIIVNVIENTSGGNSDDYREFWVQLTYNKEEYEKGQDLSVNVVCSNTDDVASAEWFVNGTSNGTDINGLKLVEGENKIKLVATSNWGQVAEDEITVTVNTSSSYTICPITLIVTPENGAVLSETVEFRGNVLLSDMREELKYYRLSYKAYPDTSDTTELEAARDNDEGYVTIVEGNTVIDNDILGTWDTTKVPNGRYFVKLYAEDTEGAYSADISNYHVSNKTDSGESSNEDKTPVLNLSASVTDLFVGDSALIEYSAKNAEYLKADTIKLYHNDEVIDDSLGYIEYIFNTKGIHIFTLKAQDLDGNDYETSCKVIARPLGSVASDDIIISLSKSKLEINEDAVLTVQKLNDLVSDVKVRIDDTEKELTNDKLSFTSSTPKKVTVSVDYKNSDGEKVTKTFVCEFFEKGQVTKPTAVLNLEELQSITSLTSVTGTASDSISIAKYELFYREKGTDEWHLFKTGYENVEDAELGKFDPTLLSNGLYEIMLSVTDQNEYVVSTTQFVVVEGELKLGAMNIGFTDFDISLGKLSLTVDRNYSSLNKSVGDFGYGWSMGLRSLKLYETNELYEGYDTQYLNYIQRCIVETKPHKIIINYGNGKIEKFKLNMPQTMTLSGTTTFTPSFTCITNPNVKLEVYNNPSAYYGDGGYLHSDETVDMFYHFDKYLLTCEDGTKIIISKQNGVQSIEDTNGNIVTFDDSGFKSNNGKNLVFERDNENRITKITAPDGHSKEYSYDENGNLSDVKDERGNVVSFKYKNHLLKDIIDPNGVAISRNIYDNDGRLIEVVDGNRNSIKYEHGLSGNYEIITDGNNNKTTYTYDDKGNILTIKDPNGNITENKYDANGNKTSTTDVLGNTTYFDYDKSGNLKNTKNAANAEINSEWNQYGKIVSISDAKDALIKFDYDTHGNVTTITDAENNATNYEYYANGQVKRITDAVGLKMNFVYDDKGNCTQMTTDSGNVVNMTYDDNGRIVSRSSDRKVDNGIETITEFFVYDDAGNISKVTDAEGNVTEYQYDGLNRKTSEKAPDGTVTTYSYDNAGNIKTITYADGLTEEFEYDGNGNAVKAKTTSGIVLEMSYDCFNNLTEIKYPNGSTETFTYDVKGRLISSKARNGGITQYLYDEADRNTTVIDPAGGVTTFVYNDQSQIIKMRDPIENKEHNGNVFEMEYDRNGNRTKLVMPDGSTRTTDYDADGRITKETDENNNSTLYTYNEFGFLTSVTDAEDNTWSYNYDNHSNLISVKDSRGNITKYSYDKLGRCISTTLPLGQTAYTEYDKMGRVVETTDYNGNKTTYTFDKKTGYLTQKSTADNTIEYSYDKKGRLSSVEDKNGTTSFAYEDTMGELIKKTLPNGEYISYDYDVAGQITKITTPYAFTEYKYDDVGRITRVLDRNGVATVYEYDENGNRTAVKYANGQTMTYSYDAQNRLVEENITNGSQVVASYKYTLGKAGERLKVEELDRTVEYSYDKTYKLISESVNGETVSYEYDAFGNRIKKLANGTEIVYTYDKNNRLIQAGNEVYSYDNNGNLLSQTGGETEKFFTYDSENRIIRAKTTSGNGVTIETYEYDYAGNRIAATANEVTRTEYLVDDYGLATVLAEKRDGNITTYTYGQELISLHRADDKKYYLFDGHGSVRALADENGNITDTYTYDAFGELTDKTGTTENSFLYCGEQYDANTGFYYLRARYMDPSVGRFVTMDPYTGSLFDPMSLHKYLYANSNPIMYTDPTGYFSLLEMNASEAIDKIIDSAPTINYARLFDTINNMLSVYDFARTTVDSIINGESIESIVQSLLMGTLTSIAINKCALGLNPTMKKVLEGVLLSFGTVTEIQGIFDALENGDTDLAVTRTAQLLMTTIGAIFFNCFTGETLISTADGLKRIDEIQVGDMVWSANVETGEVELKPVTEVFVKEDNILVHLTVNDETINTTALHPFYVVGKGWTEAVEIEVGDEVILQDGKTAVIADKLTELLDEPVKVYNFTVDEFHTYFVGMIHILVHNSCRIDATDSDGLAVRNDNDSQNLSNAKEGKKFTPEQQKLIKEAKQANKNGGISRTDAESFVKRSHDAGLKAEIHEGHNLRNNPNVPQPGVSGGPHLHPHNHSLHIPIIDD